MGKATFMVVHPDGTYQTRTTTTGRVYTGAIVKVESIAAAVEAYRKEVLDLTARGDDGNSTHGSHLGWYREKINIYERMLAKGTRYLYGRAEFRSDIEAARSEARRRTLADHGTKVEGRRQWDVYLVHPVPEGTKKSEYADLAKSVAEQWAVPF